MWSLRRRLDTHERNLAHVQVAPPPVAGGLKDIAAEDAPRADERTTGFS
jgi:hypothetical protein